MACSIRLRFPRPQAVERLPVKRLDHLRVLVLGEIRLEHDREPFEDLVLHVGEHFAASRSRHLVVEEVVPVLPLETVGVPTLHRGVARTAP